MRIQTGIFSLWVHDDWDTTRDFDGSGLPEASPRQFSSYGIEGVGAPTITMPDYDPNPVGDWIIQGYTWLSHDTPQFQRYYLVPPLEPRNYGILSCLTGYDPLD